MRYRRRIEAEDFLYCINVTHTNFYDYITFLIKKVKFIFPSGVVTFYSVVNAALRASQNGFSFSSL